MSNKNTKSKNPKSIFTNEEKKSLKYQGYTTNATDNEILTEMAITIKRGNNYKTSLLESNSSNTKLKKILNSSIKRLGNRNNNFENTTEQLKFIRNFIKKKGISPSKLSQFSNSAKRSLVKYRIIGSTKDKDEDIIKQVGDYVGVAKFDNQTNKTKLIKNKVNEFFTNRSTNRSINSSNKIEPTNNYIVKKMKVIKKVFELGNNYNPEEINIITIEDFKNNRGLFVDDSTIEPLENYITKIFVRNVFSVDDSRFIDNLIFEILSKRSITDEETELMKYMIDKIFVNIKTKKNLSNINYVVNILNLLYLDKLKTKNKVIIYDCILNNMVDANKYANKDEFVKNTIDFLYDYIALSLGMFDKERFDNLRKKLEKSNEQLANIVLNNSNKKNKKNIEKNNIESVKNNIDVNMKMVEEENKIVDNSTQKIEKINEQSVITKINDKSKYNKIPENITIEKSESKKNNLKINSNVQSINDAQTSPEEINSNSEIKNLIITNQDKSDKNTIEKYLNKSFNKLSNNNKKEFLDKINKLKEYLDLNIQSNKKVKEFENKLGLKDGISCKEANKIFKKYSLLFHPDKTVDLHLKQNYKDLFTSLFTILTNKKDSICNSKENIIIEKNKTNKQNTSENSKKNLGLFLKKKFENLNSKFKITNSNLKNIKKLSNNKIKLNENKKKFKEEFNKFQVNNITKTDYKKIMEKYNSKKKSYEQAISNYKKKKNKKN